MHPFSICLITLTIICYQIRTIRGLKQQWFVSNLEKGSSFAPKSHKRKEKEKGFFDIFFFCESLFGDISHKN